MPQITPDRIRTNGRRTDQDWPGYTVTEWRWHCWKLRREHRYADATYCRLTKIAWQLHYERGTRRLGIRYEVDEP